MGRDCGLTRSLVEPPAQCRISCKVRQSWLWFYLTGLREPKGRDCTACSGDLFQWSAVLTVQNVFLYPTGTCLVLVPVRCLLDHVLLFPCAFCFLWFCFFHWKSKELQHCVLFVCSGFVEVCVQNCSGDSGVQKWGFFLVFLSIRWPLQTNIRYSKTVRNRLFS